MRSLLTALLLLASLALATAGGTCAVFPNPQEGCNAGSLVCTCPGPLFECNPSGGQCALSICTGACRVSTIGYVVIVGIPLLVILLLILICCCCCGCCRGGRAGSAREREVIIIQSPTYGQQPSYMQPAYQAGGEDWARRGRQ